MKLLQRVAQLSGQITQESDPRYSLRMANCSERDGDLQKPMSEEQLSATPSEGEISG